MTNTMKGWILMTIWIFISRVFIIWDFWVFYKIKWNFAYLQISTLIQHRSERPHTTSATSERTLRAIGRVGEAVNIAVERFVTVGETIADDNPDIKQDMYDACKEARAAGETQKRKLIKSVVKKLKIAVSRKSFFDWRLSSLVLGNSFL